MYCLFTINACTCTSKSTATLVCVLISLQLYWPFESFYYNCSTIACITYIESWNCTKDYQYGKNKGDDTLVVENFEWLVEVPKSEPRACIHKAKISMVGMQVVNNTCV